MHQPAAHSASGTWTARWWIVAIAALSGFAGLGYEIVDTAARRLARARDRRRARRHCGPVRRPCAWQPDPGPVDCAQRTASAMVRRARAGDRRVGACAHSAVPLVGDLVPMLVPVDATPARQWFVAFALPFALLLPATLAMGGTLPALEAVLAPHAGKGGAVGRVYAANTFGAVAGTLATTFLLMPALGLAATLALCAAFNLVCAVAMWRYADVPRDAIWMRSTGSRPAYEMLAPLFLTGLLGIGYEVLTIRVVSQILENTVYTFAVLLAVYLLGTACGAALWTRWQRAGRARSSALVIATAFACLAGALALAAADTFLATLQRVAPGGMAGRLFAELGVAASVFLVPTLAMGALFADLAQAARDRAGNLGAALAANTLGAALAPIVFGPIAVPLLGAERAFALVALLYLAVLPARRDLVLAVPVAVVAIALTSVLSLRFVHTPPGSALVWHRDGVMASVSVIRDRAGDNHLQVNNRFRMGGTVSIRSDHREAHIPLLLHPDPKRALFLGLGTGATLSAAGDHPGLVADGVELVPEVVESFPLFARAAPRLGRDPNLRIHVADARRFVRATTERYDVIVADLYHPALDGSGALYTAEHFAAIRGRLTANGLFCQWLPLHQLDLATLQIIVRTFQNVFPDTTAYLAQFSVETPLIALIGGGPRSYPADWFDRRVRDASLRKRLAALDLKDDTALFGLYVAGPRDLRAFAGDGHLNSDDRPQVAFAAPRTAYAMADTPGARLVALLEQLRPQPQDILDADETQADASGSGRLANYWRARDQFLKIGARTLQRGEAHDFVAEVAPQLVDVVRLSADFDAAYLRFWPWRSGWGSRSGGGAAPPGSAR